MIDGWRVRQAASLPGSMSSIAHAPWKSLRVLSARCKCRRFAGDHQVLILSIGSSKALGNRMPPRQHGASPL
jgi:hypothetical protein